MLFQVNSEGSSTIPMDANVNYKKDDATGPKIRLICCHQERSEIIEKSSMAGIYSSNGMMDQRHEFFLGTLRNHTRLKWLSLQRPEESMRKQLSPGGPLTHIEEASCYHCCY